MHFLLHAVCNRVQRQKYSMENTEIIELLPPYLGIIYLLFRHITAVLCIDGPWAKITLKRLWIRIPPAISPKYRSFSQRLYQIWRSGGINGHLLLHFT